jgi:hypothetical protein
VSGEKFDGIGDVDTAFSGTVDISPALTSTRDELEVASTSRLARALTTEDSINKANRSALMLILRGGRIGGG